MKGGIFKQQRNPLMGDQPEKLKMERRVRGVHVDGGGFIQHDVIPLNTMGGGILLYVFITLVGRQDKGRTGHLVGEFLPS